MEEKKKMGRPKTEEQKKVLQVMLEPGLIAEIESLARLAGVTRSVFVRKLILRGMVQKLDK